MNSNSNTNCSCGNGASASNGASANSNSSGKGKKRVLKVVQFMHSGKQHGIDDQQTMRKFWNCAAHMRKFMRAEGRYVDSAGTLSKPTLLHFGENGSPIPTCWAPIPIPRKA